MNYSEYKSLVNESEIISNKIYSVVYKRLNSTGEIYIISLFINPEYRGRGYLKRIFMNICKKYKSSLVFLCYPDLVPMYSHIGAFTTSDKLNSDGLIEMYFDPFEINF